MGDIADAMINGEMCCYCCQYLIDPDGYICEHGFEISCSDCAGKEDKIVHNLKTGLCEVYDD